MISIPSTQPVRLDVEQEQVWKVETDLWPIPVYHNKYSLPDLPPYKENTIYIVSWVLAQYATNRDDFYILGGKVKSSQGKVLCCKYLIRNPRYSSM